MKRIAYYYCLFLLLVAAILGWELIYKASIQTNLTTLLPTDNHASHILQMAEQAQTKQLNTQLVLLVGHPQAEKAFSLAEQLAQTWRNSHLFSTINSRFQPDIPQLRKQLIERGIASLPIEQANLLINESKTYFTQRAVTIANPFSSNLVPLEQDWLGFTQFLSPTTSQGKLHWQPENGMLYADYQGKTWVLLRAKLPDTQLSGKALLSLLSHSQQQIKDAGGTLLASGGAIFAAYNKLQAEKESTFMSSIGICLTVLLLLSVLRRPKALLLLLPSFIGLLVGVTATLAILGNIHILTIVIGTSLVGVLIDFPIHWLTPAIFQEQWQAQTAIQKTWKIFAISLAITMIGYILLWFTPLPVLQQTAIFSATALIGAFSATLCLLPPLFSHYRPHSPNYIRLCQTFEQQWQRRKIRILMYGVLLIAIAGSVKTNWHDDIRDWSPLSQEALHQLQEIATITDFSNDGRYLLISASDNDTLIHTSRKAENLLSTQGATNIQSPAHQVLTLAEQNAVKNRLTHITNTPTDYAPLTQLGIPPTTIQQALQTASAQPNLTLADYLRPDFFEAQRTLYLGKIGQSYAAIVRFAGIKDSAHLAQALTNTPDIQLINTRAHLNHLFNQTREQALLLKLGSFIIAALILGKLYGIRKALMILTVPLSALLSVIGVFGWLDLPLGLFAAFGLLLTTAIGIDYALYALTANEARIIRIGSLNLAAATTGLSFALLALSQTPAVSTFGLSVAIGTICCWLSAVLLTYHYTPLQSQIPYKE